ncbi:MAG: hypothetical protein LUP00_03950, partial [Methanothrix sp.]|nr:hypothetical protein [Methanothrix sp.]
VVLPTRRKTPLQPESKISIGNEETTGATDAQEEEKILPSPIEEADEEEGSVPSYPQHMPVTYEEISPAAGGGEAVAAAIPDQVPEPSKEPPASYPSKEPDKPGEEKKMAMPLKAAALLGAAILIVIAAVFLPSFLPSTPTPAGEPILVAYSAYLSNTSNESYLGLDMANPEANHGAVELQQRRQRQNISAGQLDCHPRRTQLCCGGGL